MVFQKIKKSLHPFSRDSDWLSFFGWLFLSRCRSWFTKWPFKNFTFLCFFISSSHYSTIKFFVW